jgi:hypothetical protein
MADNLVTGSTGSSVAFDDIGSVFYARNKLIHGADGTNDGDVSTANPLPVRLYVGTTATNLGGGVESGALRVTIASDSTGVLSVDDNGSTISIDDGGSSITVDGTVAISGTVTVGSHAVTNAGTFAVQVDGGALTALQLIDDPVFADDAAFTLASSKVMMAGATRDDALSTLTAVEGDAVPLRVGSTGALWVGVEGTVTVGSHAVTNAGTFAVQVDGSALTALQLIDDPVNTDGNAAGTKLFFVGGTDGTNAQILSVNTSGHVNIADGGNSITVDNGGTFAVQATCTNAGTFAVQVDGAALTALQLIDDPVFADDAAFTIGTSKVMVAGGVVDDASTDAADEGDAAAIRVTTSRQVIVNPQPHTTGGLSIFRSIDLDESEEEIKATAGQVYAAWVTNTHTATLYLKFYNATAANVTVGTTTPVITIPIPGNSSDDISAVLSAGGYGIAFDTAITAAVTTGLADNDTGAPAANAFIANIFYK